MNLPNKLTVIRIILVPLLVLIWLFPYSAFGIEFPVYEIGTVSLSLLNIIVLAIFCIASFTDYLDGHLARSRNLVTTFGKFCDPIADKLLVNATLIIFVSKGAVPVVPIILMFLRDTIVDGCRMIASTTGVVIAAGKMGKLKTVLQMFAIIFTLLNNLPFELVSIPVSTILIWCAAFVSVLSGYSYFAQVKEYIFKTM